MSLSAATWQWSGIPQLLPWLSTRLLVAGVSQALGLIGHFTYTLSEHCITVADTTTGVLFLMLFFFSRLTPLFSFFSTTPWFAKYNIKASSPYYTKCALFIQLRMEQFMRQERFITYLHSHSADKCCKHWRETFTNFIAVLHSERPGRPRNKRGC